MIPNTVIKSAGILKSSNMYKYILFFSNRIWNEITLFFIQIATSEFGYVKPKHIASLIFRHPLKITHTHIQHKHNKHKEPLRNCLASPYIQTVCPLIKWYTSRVYNGWESEEEKINIETRIECTYYFSNILQFAIVLLLSGFLPSWYTIIPNLFALTKNGVLLIDSK